jgi:hypothetical protein
MTKTRPPDERSCRCTPAGTTACTFAHAYEHVYMYPFLTAPLYTVVKEAAADSQWSPSVQLNGNQAAMHAVQLRAH